MTRRRPDEMDCQELVELVTDYLEGRLGKSERARFEYHLKDCDGCATYLEQMRQTIALTGTLHEEQLDPEVQRELLGAFRNWSAGSATGEH